MKKYCSLVGLLCISLLTSCEVILPDDVDDLDENINWDADLSNPITLKAMFPATGISGFGADDSAKIVENTTGYKVEYSELSAANADNDVANIFLNQDQYDILKLTEAQYHPNAKDGTLLDLTSLLKNTESGRILYGLIDLMPNGWDAVTFTTNEGKKGIYAVPDFGYCVGEDTAFIWNTEHLKSIGYVNLDGTAKIPESLTEFDDALNKLQTKFKDNKSYHALQIPGSNLSNNNALMSAFECPNGYYLDENGNIQMYIFNDACNKYVEYMHELRTEGILPTTWQAADNASSISSFADENCSVMVLEYWWVESLINSIVAKGNLATKAGITNDYQTVHDNLVAWSTRVRGDGSHDSVVQEKARICGDDSGTTYFTCIPYYMAENAVYVIDYLAKKMVYFSEYYGGKGISLEEIQNGKTFAGETINEDYIKNNVHWQQVEAPAGAKAYYEADDYSYQDYENFTDKIIYLRPYSYEIEYEIDEKLDHPVKDGETKTIKDNCQVTTYTLNGKTMKYSVTGGGMWVQLTKRYMDQIVDNSQYCTGTNCVSANVLFHLRETGFDAWQVTVPSDETIIRCPMSMMPPMEHWAPVSILSRTVAKRGIATAIDCPDTTTPTAALNVTRESLRTKNVKSTTKDGENIKYYYWSDEIVKEMTDWYKANKLNK